MRLAIDCRMSGKSGIGAYLDNMLPTLIEEVCCEQNGSVLLLGLPQKKFDALAARKIAGFEKCETLFCKTKVFSVAETFFFPRAILKKINSCDAYFSPYCNIPCRIFGGGIKIPVFSTIHDIVFLDIPLAGRLGTFLRKMFYIRAIKHSKEIFTVSNFSKGRIQEKLHCKKPITVVYSGVPLYNEEPPKEVQKTDTIIFVGNIKAHKGLRTLIEAFSKFREEISQGAASDGKPLPRLLIVGSKENFRTSDSGLEKLLKEAGSEEINFTGFVSDEKLQNLIASARLLVQPSLYEGFGVPPLQALYSGTRAVISDIPTFKEIYKSLPVIFFKAGDADDLARKMAEAYINTTPLPPVERIYSYRSSAKAILQKISESIKMK